MSYLVYRILCSFLAGVLLTWAGSLTQLSTRNSLGSPTTLGLDGMGVLIILLHSLVFPHLNLKLFILGSLLVLSSFFYFIQKKNSSLFLGKKIILLGLCFNLFVGAIFSLVQFLFISRGGDFPSELWFGQFRFSDFSWFLILFLMTLMSFLILLRYHSQLSLLSLGKKISSNFQFSETRTVFIFLIVSLWANTWIIAHFGVFSFLGLLFPHLLRSFEAFRTNIKREVLIGAWLTGILLVLMDQVVYWFDFKGAEIPVGLVCSVFGSALLGILLIKQARSNP